jgi:4-alpha-glucanotransferase
VCVLRADDSAPGIEIIARVPLEPLHWRLVLESGKALDGTSAIEEQLGVQHRSVSGLHLAKCILPLPRHLPLGYHLLETDDGVTQIIVCPSRCYLSPDLVKGRRLWGVAAQLYALRSTRHWGIGDFTDLAHLAALVHSAGGDVLGVNPLHALFPDNPAHASPYSPSTRLLLNVLNIDVSAIPEMQDSTEAQALLRDGQFENELRQAQESALVAYEIVGSLKCRVLRVLFQRFLEYAPAARRTRFHTFRAAQTESFEVACLYQVLREHLRARDPALKHWREWPEAYRDAASGAVKSFAQEHAHEVTAQAWYQWIATEQLAAAAQAAGGMRVGLYRDLAVGADAAGAEIWSNRSGFALDATIGAPPDVYNPAGQNWGLPPPNPFAMRDQGYRSFIEVLRANMAHSAAIRIDHAMALQRLYWIPASACAADGSYVQYPLEDLLGIVALESVRHRCLVIGEDLGTVPPGFRERLARAGILSYRVVFFEQEAGSNDFIPPEAYPRHALAVLGSHDLPTLRAWWEGSDLDLKGRLALYPNAALAEQARRTRALERDRFTQRLRATGLIGPGSPEPATLAVAAHEFLARTASALALAQLDDVIQEREPVNVPGTSDEYPNWRRRLSVPVENLASDVNWQAIVERLRGARQRAEDSSRTDAH